MAFGQFVKDHLTGPAAFMVVEVHNDFIAVPGFVGDEKALLAEVANLHVACADAVGGAGGIGALHLIAGIDEFGGELEVGTGAGSGEQRDTVKAGDEKLIAFGVAIPLDYADTVRDAAELVGKEFALPGTGPVFGYAVEVDGHFAFILRTHLVRTDERGVDEQFLAGAFEIGPGDVVGGADGVDFVHFPETGGITLMGKEHDVAFALRRLHGKAVFDDNFRNSIVIDVVESEVNQTGEVFGDEVGGPRRVFIPDKVFHLLADADDVWLAIVVDIDDANGIAAGHICIYNLFFELDDLLGSCNAGDSEQQDEASAHSRYIITKGIGVKCSGFKPPGVLRIRPGARPPVMRESEVDGSGTHAFVIPCWQFTRNFPRRSVLVLKIFALTGNTGPASASVHAERKKTLKCQTPLLPGFPL